MGLCLSLAPLRGQTNAVADAPSAKAIIPLRTGTLDAVQGGLTTQIPLGPRLPGRIPLGFRWSLSINEGLRSGATAALSTVPNLGGSFRPVEWPDMTKPAAAISVLVAGEATTFVTSVLRPTTDLPTSGQLIQWMTQRGVDTGQTEAQNYAEPYPDRAKFVLEKIYPSSDGVRYYLEAHWEVAGFIDPETGERIPPFKAPKRSVVVMEDQAVWTVFNGISHLTNRWGDHVTVTETGPYMGAPTNIQIKNLADPANPITLAISNIVALAYTGDGGFSGAHRGYVDATATLTVTHSFNLPTVSVTGHYRTHERLSTWVPTGSTMATGIFDSGFLPQTVTEQASDGSTRTITMTWPQTGTIAPTRLSTLSNTLFYPYTGTLAYPGTVTYFGGTSETFTYSNGTNLGAFSFSNGMWGGWRAFPSEAEASGGVAVPVGDGIKSVVRVQTSGPGLARTIVLAKRRPKAIGLGGGAEAVPYDQPKHETYILYYPTDAPLDSSSPFKGQRLIHPSGGTWTVDPLLGGPALSDPQAYAFATGLILQRETIRGAGGPGESEFSLSNGEFNWLPTVSVVDQTATFDGYDLHSWANPNGVILGAPALSPVALRTLIHTPNLPTRIIIAGNPNLGATARDARGPLKTNEYTDVPVTAPSSGADVGVVWSGSLTEPSELTPLIRTGTITRHWDANLGKLITDTDNKTLGGSSLSGLRGVPSVNFGTTSFVVDSLGRVSSTTGTRDGFAATENTTYQANLPLPTRITKTLTQGGTNVPANPAQPVTVGHEYQYDISAFQWLSAERDLVDGRWTNFLRDALGRETQRTDPLGIVTATSYDGWGHVKTMTRQAKGNVGAVTTTFTYDPNGLWKTEKVQGEGVSLTTTTNLDAMGRITSVTFPDGSTQSTTYDEWGRKKTESPILKLNQTAYGTTTWTYDDQDRVVAITDPKSRTFSTTTQQPKWMIDPRSSIQGVVTTVQDDRGYLRTTITDLLGQKIAVVDQKGQVSRYYYDADGHLKQTDQGGQLRSYSYNSMGWLLSRTEPEEGTTSFGNITMLGMPITTTQTGRSGSRANTTTITLNAWLAPTQIQAAGPEGTTTRNLTYDAGTHLPTLMQEVQPYGTITESTPLATAYDGLYRPVSRTISDGTQSFTVSRTLDAFGNETLLSYPGAGGRAAQNLTTNFDTLRRPNAIYVAAVLRGQRIYDQVSGTAVTQSVLYANGASTALRSDKGELAQATHSAAAGVLESSAVTWSAGGLMLTRGSDSFQYDELQRLTSATVQGLNAGESITQGYTYDRWGNRGSSAFTYAGSAKPEEALAWTATYDARNGLPANVNTAGGPLSTGVVYDDLGRMTQVEAIPNNTGSQTTSWIYDPTGRVMSETVKGIRSNFLLDGEGLRFRRAKTDGSISYTLYGFHREPLMTFTKASSTAALVWQKTCVYGFGQLIAEETATGTTYIQGDQLGSPNLLTNSAGAVVGKSKTLPFGERFGSTGTTSIRRYTNHEDQPGSAIYMQARTYLPAYGKFAQIDPAYDQTKDDPETWNLYNYVTNNPVTHTDPDGRTPIGQNTLQPITLIDGFDWSESDGKLYVRISGVLYENAPPETHLAWVTRDPEGHITHIEWWSPDPTTRPTGDSSKVKVLTKHSTSEEITSVLEVAYGSGLRVMAYINGIGNNFSDNYATSLAIQAQTGAFVIGIYNPTTIGGSEGPVKGVSTALDLIESAALKLAGNAGHAVGDLLKQVLDGMQARGGGTLLAHSEGAIFAANVGAMRASEGKNYGNIVLQTFGGAAWSTSKVWGSQSHQMFVTDFVPMLMGRGWAFASPSSHYHWSWSMGASHTMDHYIPFIQ